MTLKAKDLPPPQHRPWCVFLWWKLPVTRLDLLLLQRWLVCEPASLWAKRLVRRRLKAMQRSRLSRLSFRLSCVPVSWALALVIRLDWATDLAQYKLRRIRLHEAEQKFLWS